MSKHALTRVTCIGDRVVVVAGPIPDAVAAQAVEHAPAESPLSKKHITKTPNKPPKFVAPEKEPQTQAKESN